MSVVTFDSSTLLPNLRAFLADHGLTRDPNTQGTPDPPPMWLDPKLGIPYPGQTDSRVGQYGSHPSMVLAAYPETGIASQPFEGFFQRRAVSIWFRALKSPDIQRKHNDIYAVLHDQRDYSLNGLQVNQSMMTRELQRISSDDEGYTYNTEYMFDLWGSD